MQEPDSAAAPSSVVTVNSSATNEKAGPRSSNAESALQASRSSSLPNASLLRLLLLRFDRLWHDEGDGSRASLRPKGPAARAMSAAAAASEAAALACAPYRSKAYLRRRLPDEIESVLAAMGKEDLRMIWQSFGKKALNLPRFVEVVVRTGAYDPDHILAFVAGVVDLFAEVLRARVYDNAGPSFPLSPSAGTLEWAQLLDHGFSIAGFAAGVGAGGGGGSGGMSGLGGAGGEIQHGVLHLQRSNYVDCAKHQGSGIKKVYWLPDLEMLITVEGTDSVYFWSPPGSTTMSQEKENGTSGTSDATGTSAASSSSTAATGGSSAARDADSQAPRITLTPQFDKEKEQHFDFEEKRPQKPVPGGAAGGPKPAGSTAMLTAAMLWAAAERREGDQAHYSVLAVGWDMENNDLMALLSNRLMVLWRLRNLKKGQFHQQKIYQFNAEMDKTIRIGEQEHDFKVFIDVIDKQTEKTGAVHKASLGLHASEQATLRELREEALAADRAAQMDMWWSAYLRVWVTTDRQGRLFLWDMRPLDSGLQKKLDPRRVLKGHTNTVTSFLELSKNKFTTCSLDHSIALWDYTSFQFERIDGHMSSVVSQAYLPNLSSLVTVGCETRVYVWQVDATACRGVKAKLSAHQHNLLQVTAGQKVFITLDEAGVLILWDGASLQSLQTHACQNFKPWIALCLPSLGRVCLAGRRLNFFEGNEACAAALGASPSREQQERVNRVQLEAGLGFRRRASPLWCALGPTRGSVVSATGTEVRLHERECPANARSIFQVPDQETISYFVASDALSFLAVGTEKGAMYFLKYRSGFVIRKYPGRSLDLKERGPRGTTAAAGGDSGGGGGGDQGGGSGGQGTKGARKSGGKSAFELRNQGMKSAFDKSAGGADPGSRAGSPKAGASTPAGRMSPSSRRSISPARNLLGNGLGDEAPAKRSSDGEASIHNAPTQDDVQRGLTSSITCLLISEEQHQVFAGTAEGQVLVFSSDEGFACTRWLPPPADDISAVTCLHCAERFLNHRDDTDTGGGEEADDEEFGILVVGTLDGLAHIYILETLRLAGSVNVPRALPDTGATASSGVDIGDPRGGALRFLRLFPPQPALELPACLLTIDRYSRLRVWGLSNINARHGGHGLKALELILDARQLREGCKRGTASRGTGEPKGDASKPSQARPGRTSKPKAGRTDSKESPGRDGWDAGAIFDVTAVASPLAGAMVAPSPEVLARLMPDGPLSAPVHAQRRLPKEGADGRTTAPKRKSWHEKNQSGRKSGMGASQGASRRTVHASGPTAAGIGSGETEDSGSGTDGDDADTVQRRQLFRPISPPPAVQQTAEVDGSRLIFVAAARRKNEAAEDVKEEARKAEEGWIWCIDMVASAASALTAGHGVPVCLDAANGQAPTEKSNTLRLAAAMGVLPTANKAQVADTGHLLGPAPSPRPQSLRVLGAWSAHCARIVSLVPTTSPPALISLDAADEVRVWSTAGDLWGHFSMARADGQLPTVAAWPPPHVLGAQLALTRAAKDVCHKLGVQMQARRGRAGGGTLGADGAARRAQRQTIGATSKHRPSSQQQQERKTGDVPSSQVPDINSGHASVMRQESDGAKSGAEAFEAEPQAEPAGKPAGRMPGRRSSMTPNQMAEMIKGHGFSDGFQSYKDFARKSVFQGGPVAAQAVAASQAAAAKTAESRPAAAPASAGLDSRAGSPSAASANSPAGSGAASTSGLLPISPSEVSPVVAARRSASEGALLRQARQGVDDMTSLVRDNLGVEVSSVKRRQLKRASFIAALDVAGVSSDPLDPQSATGRAARTVLKGGWRKGGNQELSKEVFGEIHVGGTVGLGGKSKRRR